MAIRVKFLFLFSLLFTIKPFFIPANSEPSKIRKTAFLKKVILKYLKAYFG